MMGSFICGGQQSSAKVIQSLSRSYTANSLLTQLLQIP